MSCFSPMRGYPIGKTANGKVKYKILKKNFPEYVNTSTYDNPKTRVYEYTELPCGSCLGCKLQRAQDWVTRCYLELKQHKQSSFITLTYSNENLPERFELRPDHLQKFMKRLRKFLEPLKIKFFACGEYGDITKRPHYHLIIFGYQFDDLKFYKNDKLNTLYTSEKLQALWHYGFAPVGSCTNESISYVARYTTKKITEEKNKRYNTRQLLDDKARQYRIPPFVRMSTRPAIGKEWALANVTDNLYESDTVVIIDKETVKEVPIPRYFNKLFKATNEDKYDSIVRKRQLAAQDRLFLKAEVSGLTTEQQREVDKQNLLSKIKVLTRHKV